MTLMQGRCLSVALSGMIWAGIGQTEVRAQFARTGYNPYGANTSSGSGGYGGGGGWGPNAAGASSLYLGTGGAVFPQTSLWGAGWGGMNLNLASGMPFFNLNPVFSPPARNSYGGVSSSSQTTRVPNYVPPAPVESSTKAFDRWVMDQQRKGRQDEAQKQQKSDDLQRSLTNPSSVDITSGQALNAILESLLTAPGKLMATKPLEIDESFIKQLNFTRGTGSIGLLRNQGKLQWPTLLLRLTPADDFAKVRGQIETRFLQAFNEVNGGGRASAENLRALHRQIDLLSEMASGRASSMTFAENLDVKRYLRSLDDSVNFMKQPDASEWMPGKQKARPKTAQELVQLMGEKSVRFAPAIVGNDEAYVKMRKMLASLHLDAAP